MGRHAHLPVFAPSVPNLAHDERDKLCARLAGQTPSSRELLDADFSDALLYSKRLTLYKAWKFNKNEPRREEFETAMPCDVRRAYLTVLKDESRMGPYIGCHFELDGGTLDPPRLQPSRGGCQKHTRKFDGQTLTWSCGGCKNTLVAKVLATGENPEWHLLEGTTFGPHILSKSEWDSGEEEFQPVKKKARVTESSVRKAAARKAPAARKGKAPVAPLPPLSLAPTHTPAAVHVTSNPSRSPATPSGSQVTPASTPESAAPTLVELLRGSGVGALYGAEKGVLTATAMSEYGVDVDGVKAGVLTESDVKTMVDELLAASKGARADGRTDFVPTLQILKLNDFFAEYRMKHT